MVRLRNRLLLGVSGAFGDEVMDRDGDGRPCPHFRALGWQSFGDAPLM